MKRLLVTAMVTSAVILGCGQDDLSSDKGDGTGGILVIAIEQESQTKYLDVVYHPTLALDAVRQVTTVHLETFPWNSEITKVRVEPVDSDVFEGTPAGRIFTQGVRTCITYGEKQAVICAHYVDFATPIEDERPSVRSLYGHNPHYRVIDTEDD